MAGMEMSAVGAQGRKLSANGLPARRASISDVDTEVPTDGEMSDRSDLAITTTASPPRLPPRSTWTARLQHLSEKAGYDAKLLDSSAVSAAPRLPARSKWVGVVTLEPAPPQCTSKADPCWLALVDGRVQVRQASATACNKPAREPARDAKAEGKLLAPPPGNFQHLGLVYGENTKLRKRREPAKQTATGDVHQPRSLVQLSDPCFIDLRKLELGSSSGGLS
eukprot:TRINITY_DN36997_c0_g2_i1.p1 TRINITY_DN36997_c0_g2~~TRINITY_DN36997_c0_g2_i1.p1  ORF type:complete len:244 (+),score=37.59 TRINITY_DN36997_c0_g2_i1:68-733(+)